MRCPLDERGAAPAGGSPRHRHTSETTRRVYLPAMRHRVILNFEAEAEGIDTDRVLLEILEKVPEKAEDQKAA